MERMRQHHQKFAVDSVCLASGLGLMVLGAAQDLAVHLGLLERASGVAAAAGGMFLLAAFVISLGKPQS